MVVADFAVASTWMPELWGKDNIHIGYYPHLVDRMAIPLDRAASISR